MFESETGDRQDTRLADARAVATVSIQAASVGVAGLPRPAWTGYRKHTSDSYWLHLRTQMSVFLLVWKAKFTLINEDLSESTDTAVHSWLLMCDLNYLWCERVWMELTFFLKEKQKVQVGG